MHQILTREIVLNLYFLAVTQHQSSYKMVKFSKFIMERVCLTIWSNASELTN